MGGLGMTTAIDIVPVPADRLDDAWPHIWPALAKGVEVSGLERREIAAGILTERMRVWMATGHGPTRVMAAWLTQILTVNGKRCLVVFGLGGEKPAAWAGDLERAMTAYAAAEGCSLFQFAGKRGWLRFMSGWREAGRVDGQPYYERAVA